MDFATGWYFSHFEPRTVVVFWHFADVKAGKTLDAEMHCAVDKHTACIDSVPRMIAIIHRIDSLF
jgi:hypothetical protein